MKKIAIIIPAIALALASFAPSAEAATLPEIKGRFDSVEIKLDKVMNKFSDVIDRAETLGKDTTEAEALYADAEVKRDVAKSEVAELKTMLDGAEKMTPEIKAQAKVTKDSLKDFKDTMVEMHDRLKELFSKKPVAGEGEPTGVEDPAE